MAKLSSKILIIFLSSITPLYAGIDLGSTKASSAVSYSHMLNWALGLLVVLSIFFACLWFMRKMGALPTQGKEGMRVISGLSVGVREKLIVVQVGKKQMVLGVSPGKIENLLVLEGQDQLNQTEHSNTQTQQDQTAKNDFSNKLKQIMARKINE